MSNERIVTALTVLALHGLLRYSRGCASAILRWRHMAWTRLELRDRSVPPQAASLTRVGLWSVLAIALALTTLWLSTRGSGESPKSTEATFRAEQHLATATVSVRKPGSPDQPCTWQASDGRWHCGAQDFAFVGPYAGLAAGKPMRCLWLHPHAGGATTVVRWADLNLGDHVEARLRLLDDVASGPPTRLQIFAGGQSVGTLSAQDGRDHPELDVDLPVGKLRGELRLEISAADNDWRLACAEVLMTGKRRAMGEQPPVDNAGAPPPAPNHRPAP